MRDSNGSRAIRQIDEHQSSKAMHSARVYQGSAKGQERSEGWTNARAIKSCRVAKTPSEFYLSFQPSFHLTAIGRESPTTFVGFPSPSASSGDQTLIGLDSGSLPPFPAFLSCEILVSLFGNLSLLLSFLLLSLSPLSLAQCSKGTLFLPLERTSAGHVSNRLPR